MESVSGLYEKFLLDSRHPALAGHTVYGRHVLPGLAYIDIVHQIFRRHGFDYTKLNLRDLSIYEPLTVLPGNEVQVEIQCVKNHQDGWSISAYKRVSNPDGSLEEPSHLISAEMGENDTTFSDEKIDIDAVRSSAEHKSSLSELYEQNAAHELAHSGFMRAEGIAYRTNDAIYLDCSVPAHPVGSNAILFHPTLIDCAAVCSGGTLGFSEDPRYADLFLPLSYQSFAATRLMQNRCIARIKNSSKRRINELSYFSVDFFDIAGSKLATLSNYAGKLVRDPGFIDPSRRKVSQPAIRPVAMPVVRNVPARSTSRVEDFLREAVAAKLKQSAAAIDPRVGFYELGLTSMKLLELVNTIGSRVKKRLSPTLLFEFVNLTDLANHLDGEFAECFAEDHLTNEDASGITKAMPAADHGMTSSPSQDKIISSVTVEDRNLAQHQGTPEDGIAIIGMAGRLPGARSLSEFWLNLVAGKDCICEIPPSRWNWRDFEKLSSPSGKPMSRWGGFIDGVDHFDPQFFRMSPREAEITDPQERLFLEVCWETIEDAGYRPETLVRPTVVGNRRKVGVFAGVMHNDYALLAVERMVAGHEFPISLSNAAIANRVSYFCNFHGPSITLDTVCSSSLTAVHYAIESIRAGDCEVALAGGVNLSLHPGKYITYGLMDMHSSHGCCQTFGKGGDGYVSAEAVGAVLLKPLGQAYKDGDHVYAVIRASGVNHVGTVSGLTVPSPVAQAQMIATCIEKSGIHPRSIGYVEAHGTGTSLGDPIEIEGLTKAFRRHTDEERFCAIGSVKSMIGHAESAAGISGLIKVALQLKHRTLVPSLHSKELNPYIDWNRSPFYVQQEASEWAPPVTTEGGMPIQHLRRAALSSFGAFGSNAHLILEEANPASMRLPPPASGRRMIVPLSAKNDNRLRAYCEKLLAFLRETVSEPSTSEVNLTNLAYTLQIGRQPLESRVAFIVENLEALRSQLMLFLNQGSVSNTWFYGNSRLERSSIGRADHEIQEAVEACILGGDNEGVASLWAKGGAVDWDKLHGSARPCRISLPTYPFAEESYWIPETEVRRLQPCCDTVETKIHPLLHRNTSTVRGLQYSSRVEGGKVLGSDVEFDGRQGFSQAVQLEMARAAVFAAMELSAGTTVVFENVVWAPKTIAVGEMHVRLFVNSGEECRYEIYSETLSVGEQAAGDQVRQIHSQGGLLIDAPVGVSSVSLAQLQEQCQSDPFSGADPYLIFEKKGIVRGETVRVLEGVRTGSDPMGQQYALARLKMSARTADSSEKWAIEPAIFAAIFDVCHELVQPSQIANSIAGKILLSAARIEIIGACLAESWAWIRLDVLTGESGAWRVDVDILDDHGNTVMRCVDMKFTPDQRGLPSNETLFFEPVWEQERVSVVETEIAAEANHWIILGQDNSTAWYRRKEYLQAAFPDAQIVIWTPPSTELAESFAWCAEELLLLLQKIMRGLTRRAVLQIVTFGEEEGTLLFGLAGMLRTAHLENPKVTAQFFATPLTIELSALVEWMRSNHGRSGVTVSRYVGGSRQVMRWNEVSQEPASTARMPWRDNGSYLITGGAGGLGLLFAREIADRAKNTSIVLTGRSPASANIQELITPLTQNGTRISYRQIEVADRSALEVLIRSIVAEQSQLNGILHCAGVIQDSFLLKKSSEQLHSVFAAKVTGTVNLDLATSNLDLDFLVLFSSIASVLGNVGQSDYATANGFLDEFAHYRDRLVLAGARKGRTVSINWPLWAEGGMKISSEAERIMNDRLGTSVLPLREGLAAFYRILSSGNRQVLVLHGEEDRVRQEILKSSHSASGLSVTPAIETAEGSSALIIPAELSDAVLTMLRTVISEITKFDVASIDPDDSLESFGIDSIMIWQLNRKLTEVFGEISKTLFFEYGTLRALSHYLVTDYPSACLSWSGIGQIKPANPPRQEKTVPRSPFKALQPMEVKAQFAGTRRLESEQDRIAIVGLSGRYAEAENVDEFWNNLKSGRDCVGEMPIDRWPLTNFFDPDMEEAIAQGKSYSRNGGFVEGCLDFDPLFFGISPSEAMVMDPQERLFVQSCWEAMEDAGYSRDLIAEKHKGRVGVFAGVSKTGFNLYAPEMWRTGARNFPRPSFSSAANRVSYLFNFNGPSMPIDTYCSASLVAVHEACEHLLRGDCEMAFAGGVNLYLHPLTYVELCSLRMLSLDGRCKSFGAGGNGFVPGEGVGVVVLKLLSRAIADGDFIHAVIRSTCMNHGGRTSGYTVPNPNAQRDLVRDALRKAKIGARQLSYIEAHGTGTELGDPIEVTALSQAFREDTADTQFCAIGSVKSNIGHCESAAGIAGLTKVVLQLKHRQLVPSLHAKNLNPNIDFPPTPFAVQQELEEWKQPEVIIDGSMRKLPRIAGISSFGAGGTNAHVILEEFSGFGGDSVFVSGVVLFVLSAQSVSQLRLYALRVGVFLSGLSDVDLASVAYTFQVGREGMDHRLGLLVRSMSELRSALLRFGEDGVAGGGVFVGEVKRHRDSMSVFSGEEDSSLLVDSWLGKGRYGKVLEFWVRGGVVGWDRLYPSGSPVRRSLPTYPFARERYWIDPGADAGPAVSLSSSHPVVAPPVERSQRWLTKQWRALPDWIECEAPVRLETALNSQNEKKGIWSGPSIGRVVVLAHAGMRAAALAVASRFAEGEVLGLGALEPSWSWAKCEGWIDLTGCSSAVDPLRGDALDWVVVLQSFLLGQCLAGVRVLGVTRGLESHRHIPLSPYGGDRAGLYRMLDHEYRGIRAWHLDADPSWTSDAVLAERVVEEFLGGGEEREVCSRDGVRYGAYLSEASVLYDRRWSERAPWDPASVLWITGGLRGLGLLCARHFVRHHGVRRLVLGSRDALPPRASWAEYRQASEGVGEKIHAIESLEAEGAVVKVVSIRLGEEGASLDGVAEEICAELGPIGGVLHTAGLWDEDCPAFVRKTVSGISRVLQPKMYGLDALVRCLGDQPLRFLVLFSSVSAAVPSLASGQSDYAMGNAFMDYVATVEASRYPVVSVQWPSWQETGMGESRTRAYLETGLLSHTDAEGLAMLDEILSTDRGPVLLPARVDSSLWSPERLLARPSPLQEAPEALRAVYEPDSGEDALELWLQRICSEELQMEPSRLDRITPFQEYGVDSILLAQMLRRIGKFLGCRVDPSAVYEHPTVATLAGWLRQRHGGAFDRAMAGQTPPVVGEPRLAPPAPAVAPAALAPAPSPLLASTHRDIAIVGFSCRFPGARNADEYWQMLAAGHSALTPAPAHRDELPVRYRAGWLDDIHQFDPQHFLLTEAEAQIMDPQALLLLEETRRLWYHAGYTPQQIKGHSVGVYLGARSQHRPDISSLEGLRNPVIATGQNYLAANLSQFFDLRGPSLVLDTACSSALVALGVARNALLAGEIGAAVVGGINLLQDETPFLQFAQRGILNQTTAFHIFDRRAQGVVLGEGVGMVLVKTLEQALSDGDTVYAVLKGLAINNDGRGPGPSAPSLKMQQQVMQQALMQSGKRPEEIVYIGTNGSGSEITDLLELKAIQAVYRATVDTPCYLGSVKPNIGHPLTAAGIANLLQLVLMLHHRQWVPFLSAQEPMPHYSLASSPLRFAPTLTPWLGPLTGALNSFADGGTNVHAILDAYTQTTPKPKQTPIQIPKTNTKKITQTKTKHTKLINGFYELPVVTDQASIVPLRASAFWKQAPLPAKANTFWKQPIVEQSTHVKVTRA